MTKDRLEVLNRHTRIMASIRAGENYKDIAVREGYQPQSIYAIARRNGIFKKGAETGRPAPS
jgi:hypothetical protein